MFVQKQDACLADRRMTSNVDGPVAGFEADLQTGGWCGQGAPEQLHASNGGA
jgi:hypothetical protein